MIKKFIIFCSLTMLIACSNEEPDTEKKSEIRKATDKVAHKLVDDIKQPLDKAESIKNLQERRGDAIREQSQ